MMRLPAQYRHAILAVMAASTMAAALPAKAQEDLWEYLPGITSGILANEGKNLISSSGLSWPDGSQALVTFWQETDGVYIRCTTYFDKSMSYTGDKCERGKAPTTEKSDAPANSKNAGTEPPKKKPPRTTGPKEKP